MTFVDDLNMDYEYANRLFFGGKLPTLPVRVKKLPGTVVGRTRYQNKVGSKKRLVPVEVVISPRLNRPWLRINFPHCALARDGSRQTLV